MRLLENLEKIKTILSDESKWTQKVLARDINRLSTTSRSDNACSWCLMGAVHKVVETKTEYREIIHCLKSLVGNLVVYNDDENTDYEDIMELLDNGIESVNV